MKQPRHPHSEQRISGFTLIEVLVALVLFTTLMTTAYQLFNTLLDNGQRLKEQGREDESKAQAWLVIAQDMYHLRIRPHRDLLGGLQPAVELDDEGVLRFIRGNLPPLTGVTPGGMQRVSYRLHAHQLQRLTWPVLDLDPGSEPEVQLLLSGVSQLSIRLLGEDNLWRTLWPYQTANSDRADLPLTQMPRMLDIALTFEDGRQENRTFIGLGQ